MAFYRNPDGSFPTENGYPVFITEEQYRACCCGSSSSSSSSSSSGSSSSSSRVIIGSPCVRCYGDMPYQVGVTFSGFTGCTFLNASFVLTQQSGGGDNPCFFFYYLGGGEGIVSVFFGNNIFPGIMDLVISLYNNSTRIQYRKVVGSNCDEYPGTYTRSSYYGVCGTPPATAEVFVV